MALEEVYLLVAAKKLGLEVIEPPSVEGKSAIRHRFSFLASSGERMSGFDIFGDVGPFEVLRTFIKQFDTGVRGCIITTSGSVSEEARSLASQYGIRILSSADVEAMDASELYEALAYGRIVRNLV